MSDSRTVSKEHLFIERDDEGEADGIWRIFCALLQVTVCRLTSSVAVRRHVGSWVVNLSVLHLYSLFYSSVGFCFCSVSKCVISWECTTKCSSAATGQDQCRIPPI